MICISRNTYASFKDIRLVFTKFDSSAIKAHLLSLWNNYHQVIRFISFPQVCTRLSFLHTWKPSFMGR